MNKKCLKPTFEIAMKALEKAGAKVYVFGADRAAKNAFLDVVMECPHCKNIIMHFINRGEQ